MQIYTLLSPCKSIPYYPHANIYHIIPMKIYTLLSPCKSIPYYPHANLYPIIPMQIYTILSPCKSIPYYPHANLYHIIPMQIYTLLSPWHDNPPPFPSAPYIYYSCIMYFFSSWFIIRCCTSRLYQGKVLLQGETAEIVKF